MSVTWAKFINTWFSLTTWRLTMKCTFLNTSHICRSTSCFRHRSVEVSTNRLRSRAHQPTCGLRARADRLSNSFWVGIVLILAAGVTTGDCYTRVTSIPSFSKGAMAEADAPVSVINLSMPFVGQRRYLLTEPSLL